jgi:hypothetical protein
MNRVRFQMLGVVMAVVVCGCGRQRDRWKDARPATTPTSGEVTFQGKPLGGAIVVFQPTAPGGIGASALTDEKGKFELRTFPPELGAVPGTYSVSVMKTEMPKQSGSVERDDDPSPIHVISVIPDRYGTPTDSGLMANIPEQGTDGLAFHLKD